MEARGPAVSLTEIATLIREVQEVPPDELWRRFDPRQLQRWTPDAFPRVLHAIDRRHLDGLSRPLLDLEIILFAGAIDRRVPLPDPLDRLREIRQRAITLGGPSLFLRIARDLLHQEDAVAWWAQHGRRVPVEFLESAALTGDIPLAIRWSSVAPKPMKSPDGTEDSDRCGNQLYRHIRVRRVRIRSRTHRRGHRIIRIHRKQ